MTGCNEWTSYANDRRGAVEDTLIRVRDVLGAPAVKRILIDHGDATKFADIPDDRLSEVARVAADLLAYHRNEEKPVTSNVQPTVTEALLQDAAAIVNGGRRASNGAPERSFAVIAIFWNAYLDALRSRPGAPPGDVTLTDLDVTQMLELFKMARGLTGDDHNRDHYLDRIGYAALGYELVATEDRL